MSVIGHQFQEFSFHAIAEAIGPLQILCYYVAPPVDMELLDAMTQIEEQYYPDVLSSEHACDLSFLVLS